MSSVAKLHWAYPTALRLIREALSDAGDSVTPKMLVEVAACSRMTSGPRFNSRILRFVRNRLRAAGFALRASNT